jgi:O-antigen chain-terminating methyltransferase
MKLDSPQIETDALAAVIRESIARQKTDSAIIESSGPAGEQSDSRIPQLKLQPDFHPRSDDHYHVNDLLQYHDRLFLAAAYRSILKRPPDEAEFLRDRKRLQTGNFNKIDLLAMLKSSPEGRLKNVRIDGLTVPALIRRLGRLPLLGYAINLAIGIVRLPRQIRDQRQFADYVMAQNQQVADFINTSSNEVSRLNENFAKEVSRLDETLAKQLDESNARYSTIHHQQLEFEKASGARFDAMDQLLARTQRELKNQIQVSKEILLARIENETGHRLELRQLISEQHESLQASQRKLLAEIERLQIEVRQARTELALQSRNIDRVTNLPTASTQPAMVSPDTHMLDALYAALEERFRGTRSDIKKQFKHYLQYVSDAAPVIDLGCGRGEWLEILNEAGITSRGVDTNQVQVELCRSRGLEVIEGDFIGYLQSLGNESAGAITGFHIIEHLSIENLVRLLNESLRVLRPGGVVIFETPNPDNVLVGSNFFYLDPTHHHPLPAELMQFLLQNRGFHPIKILNLHPFESGRVTGYGAVTERFNGYFYGPMDYAVVAWKISS